MSVECYVDNETVTKWRENWPATVLDITGYKVVVSACLFILYVLSKLSQHLECVVRVLLYLTPILLAVLASMAILLVQHFFVGIN